MADDTQQVLVSDAPKDRASISAESSLQPPESHPPRSRRRVALLLLGILAVLILAGVWIWHYLGAYESTDDAQVDGHLSAISARVGGFVTKVNIEDHQFVEKGAVLVQIDPRDYELAVDRAKAELAQAEATARSLNIGVPIQSVEAVSQVSSTAAGLAGTRAAVTAAQHQYDAARSRLQEAEANNARAQADFARYRELVAKDEVSRQRFEQAEASAKAGAAAVEAARAAASGAEQQIAEAQGRLAQAEAAVQVSGTGTQQVAATRARAQAALAAAQQRRAELQQAQLNLQYCTVVAPMSGVVNKNVEPGMNVQPGQTLLSIVSLDDVWITANFKETQLARIKPGQRVTISADAYSRSYTGHIESIAGASGARFSLLPPENATGNYVKVVQRVPVRIVLDQGQNQDHSLRLGMSVTPKVWVR